MNEKVEQLQLTAKLPEYLYVLTNLSNIGDSLALFCPKAFVDHYTGMLRFIGLEVAKDWKEKQPQYKLCVCTDFQDVDKFLITGDSDIVSILLFSQNMFSEYFSDYADRLLPYHTNLILVTELFQAIKRKEFCVALSKESNFFSQLKTNLLRYRLA